MFFKYWIFLTFCCLISFGAGELNSNSYEEYSQLVKEFENLKQTQNEFMARLDVVFSSINDKIKGMENISKNQKEHKLFSSCAEATALSPTSGVYNITNYGFSNRTFPVYCEYDNKNNESWTYILIRFNGGENFDRTWSDYVGGFGSATKEYWLGLDLIYGLTNFYGPQELKVFIDNFQGELKYALYSDFVIGNASENYQLKSLGDYSGTAGDFLRNQLNTKFTTYDNDGYWNLFGGFNNSHRTIIFMIRSKSAEKLK